MKKLLPILAVALLAIGTVASNAQTTGEVSTWNCGRMSTPTYCYGIPITASRGGIIVAEGQDGGSGTIESGQIWLDQQSSGAGFIQFLAGFLGMGEASITSPFQPLSNKGGVLSYAFSGAYADGTAYTGTLALTYTAYYSSGGGGRGGAGSGWRWVVTGGTISIQ